MLRAEEWRKAITFKSDSTKIEMRSALDRYGVILIKACELRAREAKTKSTIFTKQMNSSKEVSSILTLELQYFGKSNNADS